MKLLPRSALGRRRWLGLRASSSLSYFSACRRVNRCLAVMLIGGDAYFACAPGTLEWRYDYGFCARHFIFFRRGLLQESLGRASKYRHLPPSAWLLMISAGVVFDDQMLHASEDDYLSSSITSSAHRGVVTRLVDRDRSGTGKMPLKRAVTAAALCRARALPHSIYDGLFEFE